MNKKNGPLDLDNCSFPMRSHLMQLTKQHCSQQYKAVMTKLKQHIEWPGEVGNGTNLSTAAPHGAVSFVAFFDFIWLVPIDSPLTALQAPANKPPDKTRALTLAYVSPHTPWPQSTVSPDPG